MAGKKKYNIGYEWLKEQWLVKKRLAREIAKDIVCEESIIFNRTRKLGLKRKKIVLMSEATKRKLSIINKGKRLSEETKRRIG